MKAAALESPAGAAGGPDAQARRDLETMVSAGDDVVLLISRDLRILRMNRIAEECADDTARFRGAPFCATFCSREALCEDCPVRIALQTGQPAVRERSRCGAEGRTRLISAWPVRGEDGAVDRVVLNARDMNEWRERAEEALRLRNLEAIGILAAGVAHDFNNLLQVIAGFASLIGEESSLTPALREAATGILSAAERGRGLTGQLLSASRHAAVRKQRLAAGPALRELVARLRRALPRGVAIELRVVEPLPDLVADPAQFDQLITNLAVNAAQAMPGGGRVTITACGRTLDEASGRTEPATAQGPHLFIEVADTGCGMDAETLAHIFEPFFTTRPPGQGTGLGLSVVHNVVRNHGGQIGCESTPGRGTTFRVHLPAAPAGERAAAPAPRGSAPQGNGQTVLVVDDEPLLRRLGERLLVRHGYEVLTAENGARALEVLRESRGRIAAVLLDLNMPVMDGRQCLARIRETDPGLAVVVATGIVGGGDQEAALRRLAQVVLLKPYREDELMWALHDALRAAKGAPS